MSELFEQYPLSAFVVGNGVNLDVFDASCRGASFAAKYRGLRPIGDPLTALDVMLNAALDSGEKTTLDGIVAAHDGTPTPTISPGTLPWVPNVLDRTRNDPPGEPANGDRHIVGNAATGTWAGHEKQIAEWNDTVWAYMTPIKGMAVGVLGELTFVVFDGTIWTDRGVSFGGVFSTKGVIFDGVNEYVDIGDVAALKFTHTSAFSISTWFKTTSAANAMTMFSKTDTTGGGRGYRVAYKNSTTLIVRLVNVAGSNEIVVEFAVAANLYRDGVWHHLAMTYDGSQTAAGVKLYADDVALTPTVIQDTLSATIDGTASAQIAAANMTKFFDGNEDEISVWNKELSVTEVTEIYASGVPEDLAGHSATANLVGWWRLGEGATFPTIPDDSTNSNAGTMTNQEAADIVADTPP